MARDFDTIGNAQTRYLPIPGRSHPMEGTLAHYADGVYDGDKRLIGYTNEEIRKRHRKMSSSRSLNAKAGASGKTQRFVLVNRAVDRALDNPVQHTLAPREWVATKGRQGGLRSRANRA